MPFPEGQGVDHPLQFYAATKRANELMAHAYAHLFRLPCTGLRFFTVYGPWGRPDMAPMIFASGDQRGPADPALQPRPPQPRLHLRRRHRRRGDPRRRPHRRARPGLRPGRPRPGQLGRALPHLQHRQRRARSRSLDFIAALERALGRQAIRELLPAQPGDVARHLRRHAPPRRPPPAGARPPPVDEGVRRFVDWFREVYARQP